MSGIVTSVSCPGPDTMNKPVTSRHRAGIPKQGRVSDWEDNSLFSRCPVRYFLTINISQLFVRLWACQHHTPQKFKIRLLALRLCRGQSHVQSISDVPGQDEALLCVQGNIWCHTRQCCCHQVDFDVMMPCHSGDRDTDIITQLELKIFSFEWIATIQWKEIVAKLWQFN